MVSKHFEGLSDSLFSLPSLQPFQFGIARTERKSADIPTRVSIHWMHDMLTVLTEVIKL